MYYMNYMYYIFILYIIIIHIIHIIHITYSYVLHEYTEISWKKLIFRSEVAFYDCHLQQLYSCYKYFMSELHF